MHFCKFCPDSRECCMWRMLSSIPIHCPIQSDRCIVMTSNERQDISSHLLIDCLLNSLFRLTSKETPRLPITGFVMGIHRWPMDSPHKESVMRKAWRHHGSVNHSHGACCSARPVLYSTGPCSRRCKRLQVLLQWHHLNCMNWKLSPCALEDIWGPVY